MVCCFGVTQQSLPPVYADTKVPASSEAVFPAMDVEHLNLSRALGKVEESFQGSQDQTVILIQDAHAIPDAQKSIQRLIGHFQKNYGIQFVGLEGAANRLDPQIFKSFPQQDVLREVLRGYLEKGELTAGTASAIFNPFQSTYAGLEDWDFYQDGLRYYLLSQKLQPELLKVLQGIDQEIEASKKEAYSPELLETDAALSAFRDEREDLLSVLKILAKTQMPREGSQLRLILDESMDGAKREEDNSIEVKKIAEIFDRPQVSSRMPRDIYKEFQMKRQQFQTSQLSGSEFALYMSQLAASLKIPVQVSDRLIGSMQITKRLKTIEGAWFLREFREYAREVKAGLIKTEEQRVLDLKTEERDLLERFARLQLDQSDWKKVRVWMRSKSERSLDVPPEKFSFQYAFYLNAKKRDKVLFDKLTRAKNSAGEKVKASVMVAGGFHAEGLTQLFRENGISYAVLMPEIGRMPEENHYEAQMKGAVSWKEYIKVDDGKIDLYSAFVRGTRDRILSALRDSGMGEFKGRTLKAWRDQIIRDLSSQGRVAEASKYTRYIDEAVETKDEDDLTLAMIESVKKFMAGMKGLDQKGQLTPQNVAGLLSPSLLIQAALAAAVAPEDIIDAEVIDIDAEGFFDAKDVVPDDGVEGMLVADVESESEVLVPAPVISPEESAHEWSILNSLGAMIARYSEDYEFNKMSIGQRAVQFHEAEAAVLPNLHLHGSSALTLNRMIQEVEQQRNPALFQLLSSNAYDAYLESTGRPALARKSYSPDHISFVLPSSAQIAVDWAKKDGDFPVVFGRAIFSGEENVIETDAGNRHRPTPKGEFLIRGSSRIDVVYVPQEKMEELRARLNQAGLENVRLLPIESLNNWQPRSELRQGTEELQTYLGGPFVNTPLENPERFQVLSKDQYGTESHPTSLPAVKTGQGAIYDIEEGGHIIAQDLKTGEGLATNEVITCCAVSLKLDMADGSTRYAIAHHQTMRTQYMDTLKRDSEDFAKELETIGEVKGASGVFYHSTVRTEDAKNFPAALEAAKQLLSQTVQKISGGKTSLVLTEVTDEGNEKRAGVAMVVTNSGVQIAHSYRPPPRDNPENKTLISIPWDGVTASQTTILELSKSRSELRTVNFDDEEPAPQPRAPEAVISGLDFSAIQTEAEAIDAAAGLARKLVAQETSNEEKLEAYYGLFYFKQLFGAGVFNRESRIAMARFREQALQAKKTPPAGPGQIAIHGAFKNEEELRQYLGGSENIVLASIPKIEHWDPGSYAQTLSVETKDEGFRVSYFANHGTIGPAWVSEGGKAFQNLSEAGLFREDYLVIAFQGTPESVVPPAVFQRFSEKLVLVRKQGPLEETEKQKQIAVYENFSEELRKSGKPFQAQRDFSNALLRIPFEASKSDLKIETPLPLGASVTDDIFLSALEKRIEILTLFSRVAKRHVKFGEAQFLEVRDKLTALLAESRAAVAAGRLDRTQVNVRYQELVAPIPEKSSIEKGYRILRNTGIRQGRLQQLILRTETKHLEPFIQALELAESSKASAARSGFDAMKRMAYDEALVPEASSGFYSSLGYQSHEELYKDVLFLAREYPYDGYVYQLLSALTPAEFQAFLDFVSRYISSEETVVPQGRSELDLKIAFDEEKGFQTAWQAIYRDSMQYVQEHLGLSEAGAFEYLSPLRDAVGARSHSALKGLNAKAGTQERQKSEAFLRFVLLTKHLFLNDDFALSTRRGTEYPVSRIDGVLRKAEFDESHNVIVLHDPSGISLITAGMLLAGFYVAFAAFVFFSPVFYLSSITGYAIFIPMLLFAAKAIHRLLPSNPLNLLRFSVFLGGEHSAGSRGVDVQSFQAVSLDGRYAVVHEAAHRDLSRLVYQDGHSGLPALLDEANAQFREHGKTEAGKNFLDGLRWKLAFLNLVTAYRGKIFPQSSLRTAWSQTRSGVQALETLDKLGYNAAQTRIFIAEVTNQEVSMEDFLNAFRRTPSESRADYEARVRQYTDGFIKARKQRTEDIEAFRAQIARSELRTAPETGTSADEAFERIRASRNIYGHEVVMHQFYNILFMVDKAKGQQVNSADNKIGALYGNFKKDTPAADRTAAVNDFVAALKNLEGVLEGMDFAGVKNAFNLDSWNWGEQRNYYLARLKSFRKYIETGDFLGEPAAINVSQSVKTTMVRFEGIEAGNIKVVVPQDPSGKEFPASIDPDHLVAALSNIVSNSFRALNQKKTPGFLPELNLRVEEQDGNVVITIWDNGPGFPVNDQGVSPLLQTDAAGKQKLFSKGESASGSTGLGLWIVDRTITLAGGTIRAEFVNAADASQGAKFVITLPRSELRSADDDTVIIYDDVAALAGILRGNLGRRAAEIVLNQIDEAFLPKTPLNRAVTAAGDVDLTQAGNAQSVRMLLIQKLQTLRASGQNNAGFQAVYQQLKSGEAKLNPSERVLFRVLQHAIPSDAVSGEKPSAEISSLDLFESNLKVYAEGIKGIVYNLLGISLGLKSKSVEVQQDACKLCPHSTSILNRLANDFVTRDLGFDASISTGEAFVATEESVTAIGGKRARHFWTEIAAPDGTRFYISLVDSQFPQFGFEINADGKVTGKINVFRFQTPPERLAILKQRGIDLEGVKVGSTYLTRDLASLKSLYDKLAQIVRSRATEDEMAADNSPAMRDFRMFEFTTLLGVAALFSRSTIPEEKAKHAFLVLEKAADYYQKHKDRMDYRPDIKMQVDPVLFQIALAQTGVPLDQIHFPIVTADAMIHIREAFGRAGVPSHLKDIMEMVQNTEKDLESGVEAAIKAAIRAEELTREAVLQPESAEALNALSDFIGENGDFRQLVNLSLISTGYPEEAVQRVLAALAASRPELRTDETLPQPLSRDEFLKKLSFWIKRIDALNMGVDQVYLKDVQKELTEPLQKQLIEAVFDESLEEPVRFNALRVLSLSEEGMTALLQDARAVSLPNASLAKAYLFNQLKYLLIEQVFPLSQRVKAGNLFKVEDEFGLNSTEFKSLNINAYGNAGGASTYEMMKVRMTTQDLADYFTRIGRPVSAGDAVQLLPSLYQASEAGEIITSLSIESSAYRGSRENDNPQALSITRNPLEAYSYGTHGGETAQNYAETSGRFAVHEVDFNLIREKYVAGTLEVWLDGGVFLSQFVKDPATGRGLVPLIKRTVIMEDDSGQLKPPLQVFEEMERQQRIEREVKGQILALLQTLRVDLSKEANTLQQLFPLFERLQREAGIHEAYMAEFFNPFYIQNASVFDLFSGGMRYYTGPRDAMVAFSNPLTPEQVDKIITRLENELSGTRAELRADEETQEKPIDPRLVGNITRQIKDYVFAHHVDLQAVRDPVQNAANGMMSTYLRGYVERYPSPALAALVFKEAMDIVKATLQTGELSMSLRHDTQTLEDMLDLLLYLEDPENRIKVATILSEAMTGFLEQLPRSELRSEDAAPPAAATASSAPFEVAEITQTDSYLSKYRDQLQEFRTQILPRLIKQKQAEGSKQLKITVLNALSGEMLPSVLWVLMQEFSKNGRNWGFLKDWDISIVGVEPDPGYAEKAKQSLIEGTRPLRRITPQYFKTPQKIKRDENEVRSLLGQLNADPGLARSRFSVIPWSGESHAQVVTSLQGTDVVFMNEELENIDLGADMEKAMRADAPQLFEKSFIVGNADVVKKSFTSNHEVVTRLADYAVARPAWSAGEVWDKPFFSAESLQQYDRVVVIGNGSGLSHPLLRSWMLFPGRIREIFSNPKTRIQVQSKLLQITNPGDRYEMTDAFPVDIKADEKVLVISLERPGEELIMGKYPVLFVSTQGVALSSKGETLYSRGTEERPYYLAVSEGLAALGVPADLIPNEPDHLKKEQLSDAVTAQREKLIALAKLQNPNFTETSPVIVVNPLYGKGKFRTGGREFFTNTLKAILEQYPDAYIAINEGPPAWRTTVNEETKVTPFAEIEKIYSDLTPYSERVLKLGTSQEGENDLNRVAALMSLTDNVVMLAENSGLAHLADWMRVPMLVREEAAFSNYFFPREDSKDLNKVPDLIAEVGRMIEAGRQDTGSAAARAELRTDDGLPADLNPAIDRAQARKFIDAHLPGLREMVEFLISKVNYVDQEQYTAVLKQAIAQFQQARGDKPFVVVTDKWPGRADSIKSELFIYQQARENGLPQPEGVVELKNLSAWLAAYAAAHPNEPAPEILVLDDASYSGSQLGSFVINLMDNTLTPEQKAVINVHLLVPYLTERARNEQINPGGIQKAFPRLQFHSPAAIPTVNEIFKQAIEKSQPGQERERMERLYQQAFDTYENVENGGTLTTFWFKQPDQASILTESGATFTTGRTIDGNTGRRRQVIPYLPEVPTPPYKSEAFFETLKQQGIYEGGPGPVVSRAELRYAEAPSKETAVTETSAAVSAEREQKALDDLVNFLSLQQKGQVQIQFDVERHQDTLQIIISGYRNNPEELEQKILARIYIQSTKAVEAFMNKLSQQGSFNRSYAVGFVMPADFEMDDGTKRAFFEGYAQGLTQGVGEVLFGGALPDELRKALAKAQSDVTVRPGFKPNRTQMTLMGKDQSQVPVATFENNPVQGLLGSYFSLLLGGSETVALIAQNKDNAALLGKLTARTQVHLADLLEAGTDPALLKGELLKALHLEGDVANGFFNLQDNVLSFNVSLLNDLIESERNSEAVRQSA